MAKSKKGKKSYKKKSGKSLALKALKKASLSSMFIHYFNNSKVSRSLRMMAPDGFRTTLFLEWSAVEDAAALQTNNFQVLANQIWLPLNPTGFTCGGVTLASPSGTASGESLALSVVTKQPTGLTRLFNTGIVNCLYDVVHVIGSRIKVSYTPLSLSDTINVVIMPQKCSDGSLRTFTGPQDQLFHAKSKVITTSVPYMYCENHLNIPQFLGEDAKSYVSNLQRGTSNSNGAILGPDPDNTVFWNITRQTINNTAISGAKLPYKIQLSYDCVFHRLANADSTTL